MASAASGGRASVDAQDLLLALLVDDGAPARLLREAGVDLLALRRSLEEE
jgi:hypothetical protein